MDDQVGLGLAGDGGGGGDDDEDDDDEQIGHNYNIANRLAAVVLLAIALTLQLLVSK